MLDLDITPPVVPTIVRKLSQDDINRLNKPHNANTPHYKRLSTRHHFLAKCLASGLSIADASASAGYTTATTRNLLNDPSFKELVQHYGKEIDIELINLSGRLNRLSADALDVIQDRLETEPEKISTSELREIAKLGADRTGFGPVNTNVAVDGGNLSDRMQRAKARLEERRKTIDITPEKKDAAA